MTRMEENFISITDYRALCEKEEIVTERSQHTLLDFLHDLGIVISFQDDPYLMATGVLNPEWVTRGVYRIINDRDILLNRGVLDLSRLPDLLDAESYPKETHLFIVELMRKFELCYGFVNEQPIERVLIPDLLPKEEAFIGTGWDSENVIGFEYHYNVLPISIFTRFVVRLHEYIHKHTVWRTGVLLKNTDTEALVIADRPDRKIRIWVRGSGHIGQVMFLQMIRNRLEDIHESMAQLSVEKRIPLAGFEDETVGYYYLLELERENIPQFTDRVGSKLRQFEVKRHLMFIPKRPFEKSGRASKLAV